MVPKEWCSINHLTFYGKTNMRGLKEEQRECEFNLGNEQRVLIMKLP